MDCGCFCFMIEKDGFFFLSFDLVLARKILLCLYSILSSYVKPDITEELFLIR